MLFIKKTLCLLMMCLCLLLPGCAQTVPEPESAQSEMHIAFLGDKSEDAILLTGDDFSVLIDTGLNKTGPEIVAYMQEKGIAWLDLLVLTHYDKDHVGGADSVIEQIYVARIIGANYESDSKQYTQFIEAARARGIAIERISSDMRIVIGSLALDINVPTALYEQENDRSLVICASYGECSLLLAGDAENERISQLLSQGVSPCTLLKVPHHGRIEKLSERFFGEVQPRYAVITSSAKEPEDELVVALLQNCGAQVYLTRLGLIEGVCDGKDITLSQSLY